jgi:aryl-alcohol dehydrogenase-like predicted oxidoreductase
MSFIFRQPGVSCMISGTLNPAHLKANAQAINAVLQV